MSHWTFKWALGIVATENQFALRWPNNPWLHLQPYFAFAVKWSRTKDSYLLPGRDQVTQGEEWPAGRGPGVLTRSLARFWLERGSFSRHRSRKFRTGCFCLIVGHQVRLCLMHLQFCFLLFVFVLWPPTCRPAGCLCLLCAASMKSWSKRTTPVSLGTSWTFLMSDQSVLGFSCWPHRTDIAWIFTLLSVSD